LSSRYFFKGRKDLGQEAGQTDIRNFETERGMERATDRQTQHRARQTEEESERQWLRDCIIEKESPLQ
jgi:hypothetical protein